MQSYNYKTLNYNDYTRGSSNSISTSISTSTSTSKERTATETETATPTPLNRKVIENVRQLYHDTIGTYPSVYVCKSITQMIADKKVTWEQLEYALTETAYAPRPSWAYAAAIIKRMRQEDGLPF